MIINDPTEYQALLNVLIPEAMDVRVMKKSEKDPLSSVIVEHKNTILES